MAKNKVSFSNEELTVQAIDGYYQTTSRAIRNFYIMANRYFLGYTKEELQAELESRLDELDKTCALSLLAAIEAHINVDFYQRCYNKGKDDLSRRFREIEKLKGTKVSLSDDILESWSKVCSKKSVVSDIRSALNYRHWLAHGRYWVAKLDKKYDFFSILTLANLVQNEFEIEMGV